METFNLLKEKGYRLTPQRMEVVKIVLDKLEKREHPTFNDIVNEVKARMPSISASTVYNILRLLEENGIVVSFENNGRTYYDKAEPHINVVCIDSDKVIDVEDGELISLFKSKGIRPISIVVKAVCS
ncbi:Fur family transcriptional regulator [Thermoproteus tenax]|uniref:Ferric uptake regulation protein n=1 Tax=Thermoproteus tenax (strain ATCC 35583 / DSM 2078 / JCM 9277 / NBRC 100435 / Kra 1) TaxID=768679 RepID=G4RPT4_THETK|nr:Fur family transcriptional regulator [Thermoproteus tenax]CCC81579.1 ferric uptake regulation protein [Thermoproteus tenax Kra 1]